MPDIVANAGGVISSYAEYRGYQPKRMFDIVEKKIKQIVETVLQESLKSGENPRHIALRLAKKRVLEKMRDNS